MSTPIPEEKIAALRELIFNRRKIEAIKLYRELTGFGLKEAKDAVEELETSLRKEFPDKFSSRPPGKGCFGTAAVISLGLGVALYWIARR